MAWGKGWEGAADMEEQTWVSGADMSLNAGTAKRGNWRMARYRWNCLGDCWGQANEGALFFFLTRRVVSTWEALPLDRSVFWLLNAGPFRRTKPDFRMEPDGSAGAKYGKNRRRWNNSWMNHCEGRVRFIFFGQIYVLSFVGVGIVLFFLVIGPSFGAVWESFFFLHRIQGNNSFSIIRFVL